MRTRALRLPAAALDGRGDGSADREHEQGEDDVPRGLMARAPSRSDAVGDDPDVDAGQRRRISRCGSGSRSRAEAARAAAARRPGRRWCRARAATRATAATRSSPSSTRRCAPSTEASRRSAVELLARLALGRRAGRLAPRAGRARCRAAAPSARRGGPAAASSGCGRDQRQQPLADRLRRVGGAPARARRATRLPRLVDEPLRLDLLGHLAQRHLAQRRQVLDPEEVVAARRRSRSAG